MGQLALPLRLDDHAVFDSFYAAGNEALLAYLQKAAAGEADGGWLWGAAAGGKTHLLQAVCATAGDRSVYLPLELLAEAGPELLSGLASREIICLDDIECIAGQAAWEQALFALCNQIHDSGGQLLVAAATAPRECPIDLADLLSRLSRLPVFNLQTLDEQQRMQALQLRARHRGLELPAETSRYLLSRSRRDMASLYALLDKLDLEALRAQRRLTIPFVRKVLAESD